MARIKTEWLMAFFAALIVVTPNLCSCNRQHAQDKSEQAKQELQSPAVVPQQPKQEQTAQDARRYFAEMRDANAFNRYPDKYVCFRDDNVPSFVIVSTIEDMVDAATRSGDKETARTFAKTGDGLMVHTYYKGVASDDGILYGKIRNGEYQRELDMPTHQHIPVAYDINWKTGRYLFKVYPPGRSKTSQAMEVSGRCELIHPADTPTVVEDR
jgi:hypothetical protein